MPDPQLVAHPVHPPGHCFTCGASEGPVVDTMVDLLGEGRIYLCVRTCVGVFARLAGWSDPGEVSELREALGAAENRGDALALALEKERESKVVSVSDMVGLIDRMRDTSVPTGYPDADKGRAALAALEAEAAKRWLAASARVCSETKVDGTPCTAEALPGRDVCLSHSRRRAAAGAGA